MKKTCKITKDVRMNDAKNLKEHCHIDGQVKDGNSPQLVVFPTESSLTYRRTKKQVAKCEIRTKKQVSEMATDFSFVGNFCHIFPLHVPHTAFVIPLLLQRENQP